MGLGVFMMCVWRLGNSVAIAHAVSVAKAREAIKAEMGVRDDDQHSEARRLLNVVMATQPEMFRGPNVEVVLDHQDEL